MTVEDAAKDRLLPSGDGSEVRRRCSINDVVWLGEDSEWIGAPGHFDPASFVRAADRLYKRDIGSDPYCEMPSKCGSDVVHAWWCPVIDNPAYPDEGHFEPCDPEHPHAEAWTYMDVQV